MSEWHVEFKPSAYRAFTRLDPAVKRRLTPAIDALCHDPRPVTAKRLASPDELWRVRVGAYRVVYAIEDDRLVILVIRLGHRRDVYRGL
ncbi:MAG: type II toxin-antitoxin system RelE/ParE family toxin [Coriobacteriia bacterium]|nr:type II toxin-antitoxin system RelE/ParE family toxin [Coriobacteriia bacterium]